jgi:hypothetical protein
MIFYICNGLIIKKQFLKYFTQHLVDSENSPNFRYINNLDMNTHITILEFLIISAVSLLGYVLVKTIIQSIKTK